MLLPQVIASFLVVCSRQWEQGCSAVSDGKLWLYGNKGSAVRDGKLWLYGNKGSAVSDGKLWLYGNKGSAVRDGKLCTLKVSFWSITVQR